MNVMKRKSNPIGDPYDSYDNIYIIDTLVLDFHCYVQYSYFGRSK